MTAVILVAPNTAEVTVGSLAEFVELVYGQGYYPKTGSIDSNKAALHGGAAPSPDPASLIRLGDLQTPTSDAAAALHAELLPKWKPTRTVIAGDSYLAPDGHVIVRVADGTTRASYDTTEQAAWTVPAATGLAAVATSGAYADLTGKPALGSAAAQPTSAFDASGAAAAAQAAATAAIPSMSTIAADPALRAAFDAAGAAAAAQTAAQSYAAGTAAGLALVFGA